MNTGLGRSTLLRLSLGIALVVAIAIRAIGLVAPSGSSGDEHQFLASLEQLAERGDVEPNDVVDAVESRSYSRTGQALALVALGLSPRHAAFLLALVAAALSWLCAVAVARRLFGDPAALLCAIGLGTSLIHANFSIKLLAPITGGGLIYLALLFLTGRRPIWWTFGAVLLALGFLHDYHAGSFAVALALGIAIADAQLLHSHGLTRRALRRLLDRLWVGGLAVAAVVTHELWMSSLYNVRPIKRLFAHGNLHVPLTHPNYYWLQIFGRLDPLLVATLIVAAVVAWRAGVRRFWRATPASATNTPFLTPAAAVYTAASLVIILFFARSLSGMTRQLFLPWLLFVICGSGLVAKAAETWSSGDERRRRQLQTAAVIWVGLAVVMMVSAAGDWLVTRDWPDARVQTAVSQLWPDRAVERLRYSDFRPSLHGYERLRHYRRKPDLIVGQPAAWPFPFYEEEPFKIDFVRDQLSAHRVRRLLEVGAVINTGVFYFSPALTQEERDELLAHLPWTLRRAIRFP